MPVQYNVAGLLQEPIGSTREYEVAGRVLVDEDAPRFQDIAGSALLLRTNAGVLVTARLRGVHQDHCARCLRELGTPLEIQVEEEFAASVDVRTGAGLPAPDDPEAFRIDGHHLLDVEDAVRQYWMTAIPMQPLCQADCRGLCSSCGRDRNETDCSCAAEADVRWGALRQLVLREEGS